MKVKLIEWAMGQAPGSVLELHVNIAQPLIARGAAEAVETGQDSAPCTQGLGVPQRNKSLAARQKGKG